MNRMIRRVSWVSWLSTVLASCAPATQTDTGSAPATQKSDCGFRSASTCWTLGPRFPATRAIHHQRPENLETPTAVATASDSTGPK
jgi:hypothetical protein